MQDKRYSKSTLVTMSHALEQAALAAAEDGPLVVMALFQRLPYFERERDVYARIAGVAAATVVGMTGAEPADLPPGTWPVLLADGEELAREWTVAVLTPRFGAVLVARDSEEVEPGAATLEAGRLFTGGWAFRRDDALHEVLRLRAALGDRLHPAGQAAVDAVVDRVRHLPPGPGEARTHAAMELMVERSRRDLGRIRQLRRQPGLTDEPGLRRWSGGVTASGTLPVAVLGVRITHAEPVSADLGRGAVARRAETVVTTVTSRLRPADRAVRVAEDEFVLTLPALTHDEAVAQAYQLGADIAAASAHSPFLSATAAVAVTVTRRRPLPIDRVREALRWAVDNGVPVATLADG